MIACSYPGLLVANDRVSGTTDCIKTSKRACKALAECILACSFLLLPHLPFVNHFYANSSPSRWCAILLFQYLIEKLSRHFFRLFTTRFDVFRAYSIAVARLTFFSRLSIAACTSFLRTPESHLSCPRSLVFSIFCSFHLCSDHTLHCHLSLRRATCCGTLRRRWQFLSEMSPFSPFSSFVLRMSVFFLADLIRDMFLIPLNFSRICCVASFLFALLLFLIHFLILLLTSFSCCLSSLAMVLLSLMSLLISSSLLSVFLLRLPVAPSFVHPSA